MVVLWGLDGTLVDSEPLYETALRDALTALGIAPPLALPDAIVGADALAIHGWCRSTLGLELGFNDWLRLLHRGYVASADALVPRDRAPELFIELERHGRRQAVVSNAGRIVVEANLRAVGLHTPHRISVSRNDVRAGKPDPEPYLRAAWLLGAAPESCIVVEDSQIGARAGVTAGMRTLFWPQRLTAPPQGAEPVADIGALEAILRAA